MLRRAKGVFLQREMCPLAAQKVSFRTVKGNVLFLRRGRAACRERLRNGLRAFVGVGRWCVRLGALWVVPWRCSADRVGRWRASVGVCSASRAARLRGIQGRGGGKEEALPPVWGQGFPVLLAPSWLLRLRCFAAAWCTGRAAMPARARRAGRGAVPACRALCCRSLRSAPWRLPS